MGPFRYGTARRYPIQWNGEGADVATIDELMVALEVLNRQHDRDIVEQLRPVIGDLIAAGDRAPAANLKILLKELSAEDRLFVVEVLGARLLPLVGTAVELRNLLVSLADLDVEAAILRTMGAEGLRHLIATCRQLWEILEWLYGDNDVLLLELLGPPAVRSLVVRGDDLAEILCRLDPDRQLPVLQMLGWDFVLGLMRDAVDLREVLSALCTDAYAALIARMPRSRIVELAGSDAGWYELGRRLSFSKTVLLSDKLKGGDHAA
jgi:hypothetical protein